MRNSFLDAVKQGRNEWWRYLLSVIVIFFGALVLGSMVAIVVAVGLLLMSGVAQPLSAEGFEQALNQLMQTPSIENYVVNNIPFIFMFLGIWGAVHWIHERPIGSLISSDRTFQWGRFSTGFGIWFGLQAVLLGVSYLQAPEDLVWTFSPMKWAGLVLISLIMTPIQIGAEELLCRAYLMQGLSLLTRNRWVLICLPSLLFALAHFNNPEMARDTFWMGFQYWSLGVFLAALTLRDNRLELALGIHAAQNLFVLWFANSEDSVLKTPSMWTFKETGDPKWGLVVFLIQAAVFVAIVFRRRSGRDLSKVRE